MSEQTSVAPCCVSGHIHEGVPTGNFETVHGLRTYVSNPKEASSGKQDTVIFLSDIFGVDLVNTKLVADEWAGQGYKVLLPDLFDNDPVPHQHLKAIVPNVRDKEKSGLKEKAESAAVMATSLGPWLVKHREAVSKPIIEKFVQDVKSDANTGKIITVGFCWGGRYSLLLANDDSPVKTDVAIAFHPSFLVEADLKNINSIPVGIFAGEEDDMMSIDQLNKFEQDLKPRLNDKLVVEKYPGAVHGFAVRGDDMVASEKKTKEDSHQHAFKFVKRWVQ